MSTMTSTTVPAGSGSFSGWRLMFRLAGLFNVAVAIPLWIAPVALSKLFGFEPVPTDILYTDLFAVLVITFGIGYWRIGADPVRNRVMVEMGIIGKLLVVLVGYQHFLAGTTSLPFAALVTGDLVWASLFWRYLSTHAEQRRGA
jgi:energy-converting hydrogenase Eha subunit E